MKIYISLLSTLITAIGMTACYASPISDEKNMSSNETVITKQANREFIKRFDYEIQNRAFALNSMKAAVKDDNQALSFFKAYLALEKLNQKLFSPIAKKHQLNIAPRWWTRTRTTLGVWGSALMPEMGAKIMHSVTVKYVPKLEELERLSPAQDKAFFSYVVAQEKAQAEASGLLVNGDVELAAAVLNNFVLKNRNRTFN